MTQNQIQYLQSLNWKPDKVVGIPEEIVNLAEAKHGFSSACVKQEDPKFSEVFNGANYLAFVPWLKTQGLWAAYEEWFESTNSEKGMSLAGAKVETSDLPPIPASVPEIKKKEMKEPEYTFYVNRVDYLKSLGFEMDTSVNGYVKNGNRFIDANIVKNFSADIPKEKVDEEYIKFVEQRSKINWENPIEKAAADALQNSLLDKDSSDDKVPDVTAGLDVVINDSETEIPEWLQKRHKFLEEQGFEENKEDGDWFHPEHDINISVKIVEDEQTILSGYIENAIESVRPEEKEPVLDFDSELKKRQHWLKENGFEQNPNTYQWSRGGTLISHSMVTAFDEQGLIDWEAFMDAEKSNNEVSETKDIEVEHKEVKVEKEHIVSETKVSVEADEIEESDLEAAAEKMDEIIAETKDKVATNFFKRLYNFNFKTLVVRMTRLEKSGEVNVEIEPVPFEEDPAFKNMRPLTVKSTVEELDAKFFEIVQEPLQEVEKIFHNSDSFLKELREKEKETKRLKEKADKLKKAVDALEKYVNDKGDKVVKKTLTSKIEAVLDLDSENKVALKIRDEHLQKSLL